MYWFAYGEFTGFIFKGESECLTILKLIILEIDGFLLDSLFN
jgi:hypothetical protein